MLKTRKMRGDQRCNSGLEATFKGTGVQFFWKHSAKNALDTATDECSSGSASPYGELWSGFPSVRVNILAIIVPILALILFGFATLVENSSYRQQLIELQERQQRVTFSQVILLAEPVKQQNTEVIQLLLATIIGDPYFAGAQVSTPSGEPIMALGENITGGGPKLRFTQDIMHVKDGEPTKIAQLTTLATMQPINELVARQRSQLIVLAALVLLTIIAAVYLSYRIVVGRRLQRLVCAIRSRQLDKDTPVQVESGGRDEIAVLIEDFNNAELERVSAQRQLLNANLTLEENVRDRTEALSQALARVEAADKSKSAFLSNMSHELRTPLNAVIGFAEVISRRYRDVPGHIETQEEAGIIVDSGRHLLDLLNSILEYSKAQYGKLKLFESEFDSEEVISSAVRMFSQNALENGITLVNECESENHQVYGDARKVSQVLFNLLSNAIKFTGNGGRINVSSKVDSDGLSITVADTGTGLTAEEIELVMVPFEQADNAQELQAGGSGLGLPLSREFAEMHGGTILVESVKGEGTSVTLRLPANRIVSQQNQSKEAKPSITEAA